MEQLANAPVYRGGRQGPVRSLTQGHSFWQKERKIKKRYRRAIPVQVIG